MQIDHQVKNKKTKITICHLIDDKNKMTKYLDRNNKYFE